LDESTEAGIRAYILTQRRNNIDNFAHVVTAMEVLVHASRVAKRQLTEGWLVGFLLRQR
jgi:hypothetical protein